MASILFFVLLLAVLVTCHEGGHYGAARALGIPVRSFSLGWGPVLWRKRSQKGTQWCVCCLPLGGYVRMEDIPSEQAPPHVLYQNQSVPRRLFVVLAGPAANVLLALVLYAVLGANQPSPSPVLHPPPHNSMAAAAGVKAQDHIVNLQGEPLSQWSDVERALMKHWGQGSQEGWSLVVVRGEGELLLHLPHVPETVPKTLLSSWGLWPQAPQVPMVLRHVVPGSPAAQAGLQAGDALVTQEGTPVLGGPFMAWVHNHPNAQRTIHLMRNGQAIEVLVHVGHTPDQKRGYLGVALQTPEAPLSGMEALQGSWQKLSSTTHHMLWGLGQMAQGHLSWSHVQGPVRLAHQAGVWGHMGWEVYLGFMAYVSVGLALMNLLPVPGLDGGQAVMLLAETVRGQAWTPRQISVLNTWGVLCVLGVAAVALMHDVLWWLAST